jgi:hypothetical protein
MLALMFRLPLALTVAAALAAQTPGDVVTATFTDVHWLPRHLGDVGQGKATVLFFTSLDCPLVQRYLPAVRALSGEFGDRDVRFLLVNVGSDGLVDAAGQCVEQVPAAIPAKDFDLSLTKACGVERTATAVVLDAAHRVVYRGRVDGQYTYAGTAPSPGRQDLREAIVDVLAGVPVRVPRTTVEGCLISAAPAPGATAVTFSRQVAPLLQQHCETCHRASGQAPFPLQTFADASKHRAMLGEVVAQGRMPPWHGSSRYGTFVNHRGLDDAAKATIANWVAAGGPLGDEHELPPPRSWPPSPWRIGEPDQVIRLVAPVHLPADGNVAYKYFVLPFRFAQDTWVEAIEIKPENPRVLHHCNLARVQWGESFRQDGFVTGLVPGGDPMVLDPGTAVRIPAGAALALQAHYVTSGRPEQDRIAVGLRFPRVPVQKELRVMVVADHRFAIPPGAVSHPVEATRQFRDDALGIGLFVHMHVRGRDMAVRASAPDGTQETLLLVPTYHFDWQQSYRWSAAGKAFSKGTSITALAHYDNSAFNPFNPDPQARVTFGLETADEMMFAFLFYVQSKEALALQVDAANGHVRAD